jgi:hypothetical protein
MVKNRTQTKNKSSLRSSAWVASLVVQLIALIFVGIIALSFGVAGITVIALLAAGYTLLVMRTSQLIKGKLTDEGSISTLTAIHLVIFVVSMMIIAVFLAFYYGTTF